MSTYVQNCVKMLIQGLSFARNDVSSCFTNIEIKFQLLFTVLKVQDKHGISPLLAAIFENHKECVKLLLAKVRFCLMSNWNR